MIDKVTIISLAHTPLNFSVLNIFSVINEDERKNLLSHFFVLIAHSSRRDFQYDKEVFYSKERFLTTTSVLMYEKRSASSEAN